MKRTYPVSFIATWAPLSNFELVIGRLHENNTKAIAVKIIFFSFYFLLLNLDKDTTVTNFNSFKLSYFVSKLTVTPICHLSELVFFYLDLGKIVKLFKNFKYDNRKKNVSVENIFPLIKFLYRITRFFYVVDF
jgi:hypothetical protein